MNLFDYDRDQLLSKWREMIEKCEPISNWTTGTEIAWLAEAASTRHLVAEVGSFKGKSAKAMAWSCPGVIHAVDRFQDGTRAHFEVNLAMELADGRVILHDAESAEGAVVLGQLGLTGVLEMVFIDASHDMDSVVRDILIWEPMLAPGGLLCGHDCWPGDPNNGVAAALKELKVDYHVAADSIWARRIP